MAVKIRLKRIGAKKKPCYRIVVADARYPRDGRFIEQIGIYDPMPNPAKVIIDGDKALSWIKNGAQPTDTVRALLKSTGALEKAKNNELNKAAAAAVAAENAATYDTVTAGVAGAAGAVNTADSDKAIGETAVEVIEDNVTAVEDIASVADAEDTDTIVAAQNAPAEAADADANAGADAADETAVENGGTDAVGSDSTESTADTVTVEASAEADSADADAAAAEEPSAE